MPISRRGALSQAVVSKEFEFELCGSSREIVFETYDEGTAVHVQDNFLSRLCFRPVPCRAFLEIPVACDSRWLDASELGETANLATDEFRPIGNWIQPGELGVFQSAVWDFFREVMDVEARLDLYGHELLYAPDDYGTFDRPCGTRSPRTGQVFDTPNERYFDEDEGAEKVCEV